MNSFILCVYWAAELIASHHIAKCKKNAAEQDDSKEKSHQVPALKHSIAAPASALSSRRHTLLFFRRYLHPL